MEKEARLNARWTTTKLMPSRGVVTGAELRPVPMEENLATMYGDASRANWAGGPPKQDRGGESAPTLPLISLGRGLRASVVRISMPEIVQKDHAGYNELTAAERGD